MTLASAAFGFGQPLRPNLMFLAGVLALGRVLWWIRTLHIEIRRHRDNFLDAGFLSPPVSDRASPEHRESRAWTGEHTIAAHHTPSTHDSTGRVNFFRFTDTLKGDKYNTVQ